MGAHDFTDAERDIFYRVIHQRRDIRSRFLDRRIPTAVLGRVLDAAHHAPSVGFMQPWDFILIESLSVRSEIFEHFHCAKQRADIYSGERQSLYRALKLEGIRDAPLNICVTCDRARDKGHGLGRQSDQNTDLYSTVCAIQNFWLAARAESLGVGWVSILEPDVVKKILCIPEEIALVGYLCVGYVAAFGEQPELESAGWESRTPLRELLHFDSWDNREHELKALICEATH